jgi:uncharacterized protein YebE (UPF0316 family)
MDSSWAALAGPLFIFTAEVCVVTISTLRTIFIAQGKKYLAPALGFFEVTTWLFAIGAVMQNLSDVRCSLAFAGGFTLGNFLGILIEQKLALGTVLVRAITARDPAALVERLHEAEFGVTLVEGQGAVGPVRVVLTVVPRKHLPAVVAVLQDFDPAMFYSVDGLQTTAAGVFPLTRRRLAQGLSPVGSQGLSPLAIDCRPSGARRLESRSVAAR